MPGRIHRTLFYTLLLVVYGSFFFVESFHNFEGNSDAKKILTHGSLLCHPSAKRAMVRTSALPDPSSHHIRLNKRFHQTDFPPCIVYQVASPVRYITPRMLSSYTDAGLPFITIFHFRLRGPPIAA